MNIPLYVATSDPVLRTVAAQVDFKDIRSENIQTVIDDVLRVAEKEVFIAGLAAPQIGYPLQIIAMNDKVRSVGKPDFDPNHKNTFSIFINPHIVSHSSLLKDDLESCFSIPGLVGRVARSQQVKIVAYDRKGNLVTIEAEGYYARVFQHEIDHLHGVMYPDRIFHDDEKSEKLHFLYEIDDTPEHQETRKSEYRTRLSEWHSQHGSLDGFVWDRTVHKAEWDAMVFHADPNRKE
ncbi:peptide deformylase [Ochrobactrum sp. GPK 3]|uniref:peptide deformylase n=1 Tax=Brucella sp. 22210 TaxID=3453892 RepID=UPI0031384B72